MIKQKVIYIILFASTLLPLQAKFSASVDTNAQLIGAPITLELTANEATDFIWPILKDTLTKQLEILTDSNIDTIDAKTFRRKITITSWDTGYFVVPPISVLANNVKQTTAPILLRFNTVSIDTQKDIKPIKEQLDAPFSIYEVLNSIIIAAVVTLLFIAVIVLLTLYFITKKRKSKPKAPARPAIDLLWDRYHTLAESKLWEKAGEKEFQVELSLILRSFLELQHNIKALEETTTNIKKQLQHINLSDEIRQSILHLLNFSDLVKYAKQKGIYTQHENALIQLKEVLNTYNKLTVDNHDE